MKTNLIGRLGRAGAAVCLAALLVGADAEPKPNELTEKQLRQAAQALMKKEVRDAVLAWAIDLPGRAEAKLPDEVNALVPVGPAAGRVLAELAGDTGKPWSRSALLLLERGGEPSYRPRTTTAWRDIPRETQLEHHLWMLRRDEYINEGKGGIYPPWSHTGLVAMGPVVVPAVTRAIEAERADANYARRLAAVLTEICKDFPALAIPAMQLVDQRFPEKDFPLEQGVVWMRYGEQWQVRLFSAKPDAGEPQPPVLICTAGERYYERIVEECGANALTWLLSELADANPNTRRHAVSAASRLEGYCPAPLLNTLCDLGEVGLASAWATRQGDWNMVPRLLRAAPTGWERDRGSVESAVLVLADRRHGKELLEAFALERDERPWALPLLLGNLQVDGAEDALLAKLAKTPTGPEGVPPTAIYAALGALRSRRAAPILIRQLSLLRRTTREEIGRALIKIGTRDAIEAVMKETGRPFPYVDGGIGKYCSADLMDLLEPEARESWNCARETIGAMRDPKAIPRLVELTKDESRFVRYGAFRALARFADKKTEDTLIAGLRDDFMNTRRDAAEALGRMRSAKAVPDIIAALALPYREEPRYGYDNWYLGQERRAHAEALTHILGATAATERLAKALPDTKDPDGRLRIALCLADVGRADGAEIIAAAAKRHDPEMRMAIYSCVYALQKLGRNDLIDELVRALPAEKGWPTANDLVPRRRADSAPAPPAPKPMTQVERVLAGRGDLSSALHLTGPLKDDEKKALADSAKGGNILAVLALGSVKATESEDLLVGLAKTGDLSTQFAALYALGGIAPALGQETIGYVSDRVDKDRGALRWAALRTMAHTPGRAGFLSAKLTWAADPEFADDVLCWLEPALRGYEGDKREFACGESLRGLARLAASPFRRIAALRCLAALGQDGVKELQFAAESDADPLVRAEAAGLLLKTKEPPEAALAVLRKSLREGYATLQVRTAAIMGESGRREFLKDLDEIAARYGAEEQMSGWFWQTAEKRKQLRERVATAARAGAEELKQLENK